jgi:MFS family permease
VHGLVDLSIWRVVTGLGIGGMLAAINAVSAEFSNARRRDFCVSVMSIGYPVGAVTGGLIAARLLVSHDWRSVFYLGATAAVILLPLVFFLVPESVHWLSQKQPAGALDQINKTLRRLGHAAVVAAGRSAEAVGGGYLQAGASPHHGAGDARVFLPHRDLLFHFEMGTENRRGFRLRGVLRGWDSGMD